MRLRNFSFSNPEKVRRLRVPYTIKNTIRLFLQKVLGFHNYLSFFSLFKIYTLKYDTGENDFIHFMREIKKNGIILDIGANVGLMSISLAKKFSQSEVYSFEPIPCNILTLKKNIAYFQLKNIKVFEFALGNKEGKVEMIMPEINSVKMQGLCHVIDESIPKSSSGEKFISIIRRLDNLKELQNLKSDIVAIKLDVEHFEWAVLEGAKGIIEKYKPLIYCELCEGRNKIISFKILKGLGYIPLVVINNKITEYSDLYKSKTNFIFVCR